MISIIGLPEFEKEPGTKTSTSLYFYFKRQVKEKNKIFAPFPSPIEKFAKTSIGIFGMHWNCFSVTWIFSAPFQVCMTHFSFHNHGKHGERKSSGIFEEEPKRD